MKMPKMIKDVIEPKEPEEERLVAPEPTELEDFAKKHKDRCQTAEEKVHRAISMMHDRGLPVIMVEDAIDAELDIRDIRQLGIDLIKKYRADTEEERKTLREAKKEKEEKEKNKKEVKALMIKKLGRTGDEEAQ